MKLLQTTLMLAMVGLTTSIATHAQTEGSLDRHPKPASEKVDASALLANPRLVSRIIIHFAEDDVRNRDAAALEQMLEVASRTTGHSLQYVRTLGEGGVLVEIQNPGASAKNMDLANQVGLGVPHATVLNVMEAVAMDPQVVAVEPDGWVYRSFAPNDARFPEMWHLHAFPGINVEPAWDRARGNGVRVAVLDTGIVSHPDLNANVIGGWDMISDKKVARDDDGRDSNPADEGDWVSLDQCPGYPYYEDDSTWHGTHVAGTIAATTNNSSGIAGIAFGARIMPVRVLGACGGAISDLADAISWASGGAVEGATTLAPTSRAQILNLSLGEERTCPTALQDAINAATGRGSTVIVSTFNEIKNANFETPGNCQNVVVVTSSTRDGRKAATGFGSVVDVAAPGQDVLSTINLGRTVPGQSGYDWWGGTSMATPHVSGAAALLLSYCSRTPAQVEAALRAGVRPFASPCSQCGTGIIDANKVLDQCHDGSFYENGNDYSIPDPGSASSTIRIRDRPRTAPSALQVRIRVAHPNVGQLKVELSAPGGQNFLLHNRTGSHSTLTAMYTIDASASMANGAWNLQVTDMVTGHAGHIDHWSLQF